MTLFEKIIARQIPADIVHEDEVCIAFRDINPQAPVHILVVPKKPIACVGAATEPDRDILGHLLLAAARIASAQGLQTADKGFRLVINQGRDAGESVPHLHVHLLGGRPMTWPPG